MTDILPQKFRFKFSTTGCLAVITGASSGIGQEFARQLAAQGFDLLISGRRRDRLELLRLKLMQTYSVEIDVWSGDLATLDGLAGFSKHLQSLTKPWGILVNNAGCGWVGPHENISFEHDHRMQLLNMVALSELTRVAAATMKRQQFGHIIQVSSVAAFQPTPYFASYGASKAYVRHFSSGMIEELASSGVVITILCPGMTDTEFFSAMKCKVDSNFTRVMLRPDEVVRAALEGAVSGRVMVVPGWSNRLYVLLLRVLPERVITRLAARFIKKVYRYD